MGQRYLLNDRVFVLEFYKKKTGYMRKKNTETTKNKITFSLKPLAVTHVRKYSLNTYRLYTYQQVQNKYKETTINYPGRNRFHKNVSRVTCVRGQNIRNPTSQIVGYADRI